MTNFFNTYKLFLHFLNELLCIRLHVHSATLPRSHRFAQQLRRQYRGISKPRMIWDVLLLVTLQLISMGFPITALGALLQFDCFLRPAELSGILVRHIAFPGGKLLGSKAKKVLILLPRTKTGPLQSVRVESKLVDKLLRKATKKQLPDILLFPSITVYRQRLKKALYILGLQHIGYTPHSIRHGAATMALINKGERALPGIMFRGRWESAAGKSYLQMGAAALIFAELPEALILQAKDQEDSLPHAFKHLQWIPKC